jgi:hypothetical protein
MKQSARVSMTPSNLSESVHHRLHMYALAASAAGVGMLALAQFAEAKIVYTPAHIKLTPNHKFRLDLNHDGIKDFELDDIASGSSAFLEIHPLQSGNALAAAITDCNPSVAVGALQAGVLIGKGQFYATLYCMAQKISEGSFGSWPGVKNRYLGLQFVIKGKKHFGWARLSVSRAPYVATLTGYAYETIPNKPIIAGKMTGPDNSAEQPNPTSLTAPTRQPATLGQLALGSRGLSIWRREETSLGK